MYINRSCFIFKYILCNCDDQTQEKQNACIYRWAEFTDKIQTRCPSRIMLEWPVLQFGEFILEEMVLRLTMQKDKARDILHSMTKKFVAASICLMKKEKPKKRVYIYIHAYLLNCDGVQIAGALFHHLCIFIFGFFIGQRGCVYQNNGDGKRHTVGDG